jgi:hypothetical protein
MQLRTVEEAWTLPRDGTDYIPGGAQQAISMHGEVDMCTLYIDTKMNDAGPRAMCVVAVSNLLRELILAMSEELILYDHEGRGGLISQMIELEIARTLVIIHGTVAERRQITMVMRRTSGQSVGSANLKRVV